MIPTISETEMLRLDAVAKAIDGVQDEMTMHAWDVVCELRRVFRDILIKNTEQINAFNESMLARMDDSIIGVAMNDDERKH